VDVVVIVITFVKTVVAADVEVVVALMDAEVVVI
jgi:hypothetical protein